MAIYLAQKMSVNHDSAAEMDIHDLSAMGGN